MSYCVCTCVDVKQCTDMCIYIYIHVCIVVCSYLRMYRYGKKSLQISMKIAFSKTEVPGRANGEGAATPQQLHHRCFFAALAPVPEVVGSAGRQRCASDF